MYCTYCGSYQHEVDNCPKTWGGQINRAKMYCTYCGSKKHYVSSCPNTWEGNADRAWNEGKIKKNFVKD